MLIFREVDQQSSSFALALAVSAKCVIHANHNKKICGAECRHGMRPSAQSSYISGADSELGLTMG